VHTRAVALLKWQYTKLHTLLQWQDLKPLKLSKGRANMQQQQQQQQQNKMYTCGALAGNNSNNNNKARCIPAAELCKLSPLG
jgi:hypothetical protein